MTDIVFESLPMLSDQFKWVDERGGENTERENTLHIRFRTGGEDEI